MMNILAWFQSQVFSRYRAIWLYRRGMMRAKLHKNQAAIADYTTVIDMKGVPIDIRAMTLYNRALVHHVTSNESAAIDDLRRVLDMADATENIKTEARRKLVRMERTTKRTTSPETSAESHSPAGLQVRTEAKPVGKHTDL